MKSIIRFIRFWLRVAARTVLEVPIEEQARTQIDNQHGRDLQELREEFLGALSRANERVVELETQRDKLIELWHWASPRLQTPSMQVEGDRMLDIILGAKEY